MSHRPSHAAPLTRDQLAAVVAVRLATRIATRHDRLPDDADRHAGRALVERHADAVDHAYVRRHTVDMAADLVELAAAVAFGRRAA